MLWQQCSYTLSVYWISILCGRSICPKSRERVCDGCQTSVLQRKKTRQYILWLIHLYGCEVFQISQRDESPPLTGQFQRCYCRRLSSLPQRNAGNDIRNCEKLWFTHSRFSEFHSEHTRSTLHDFPRGCGCYIQKRETRHAVLIQSSLTRWLFEDYFQYAEVRGLTSARIAGGIRNPRIVRPDSAPKGPGWKDVRRLLEFESGTKTAELRAAAIISLCSIYGLRSKEVVNLTLRDFDWISEIFVVVRAKGGRVQQFPIQFEVGETILRYLQHGRPRCSCRRLFVSLRPPYRPLRSTTIWGIVADRMKRLEIKSGHFGGHSLRHSCATELLRKGSSLREIADFLGHRTMKSVSVYAKYDIRSLRKVAEFSLAGVKLRSLKD